LALATYRFLSYPISLIVAIVIIMRIIDNYAPHKHPAVQHWLKAHGRFHMHFTLTSSSWLNLVERFFGELTSEVVREGSFRSLREFGACYIESYPESVTKTLASFRSEDP
jgi:DDE superfamily endonuclease